MTGKWGVAMCLAVAIAGCNASASVNAGGRVRVVAAENFWGSIASQLGGARAQVTSIIVNPAQDPHSYEPAAADARTLAGAQLAIVNGVGYDPWASHLLSAAGGGAETVLDVGKRLGFKEGDNPHRWYSPADVDTIAAQIAADLEHLDPHDASYFRQQLKTFESKALATYHQLIAQIASRYAGTPVGASESIFALLAPGLRLNLITSPTFMRAISEGTEVTAADTITTQRQIEQHQIKVWVYNSQNTTPAIQHLNTLARAAHIPIATVTETLSPAGDSFEQWQVAQLQRLQAALHAATGR